MKEPVAYGFVTERDLNRMILFTIVVGGFCIWATGL